MELAVRQKNVARCRVLRHCFLFLRPHMRIATLFVVLVICAQCLALLPGIRPTTYVDGQEIKLLVNKMTSPRTQLPYAFYSLPFCKPIGGVNDTRENLGEMLMGDRLENSRYEVNKLINLFLLLFIPRTFILNSNAYLNLFFRSSH